MRSERPRQHILDAGDVHWRGGVVWAITGATATIRVQCEATYVRNFSVQTAALPCAAIGAPIVVRVSGAQPDAMVIEEMRGSSFHPMGGPGPNQAGAVARGEFHPGIVTPAEGANWEPWWTA